MSDIGEVKDGDAHTIAFIQVDSGLIGIEVGKPERRMRLRREPWGSGWSATESFAGIGRGMVFNHWHEMMAYALERQALTPAEYQAAYEMQGVER
jgi:hypothetical protein